MWQRWKTSIDDGRPDGRWMVGNLHLWKSCFKWSKCWGDVEGRKKRREEGKGGSIYTLENEGDLPFQERPAIDILFYWVAFLKLLPQDISRLTMTPKAAGHVYIIPLILREDAKTYIIYVQGPNTDATQYTLGPADHQKPLQPKATSVSPNQSKPLQPKATLTKDLFGH